MDESLGRSGRPRQPSAGAGHRRGLAAALALILAAAGCVAPPPPLPPAGATAAVAPLPATAIPPQTAAANFLAAVERVEPVAEALCRTRARRGPCDFRIVVDDRRGQPPNAFQTFDRSGRPVIGFTLALIAGARNVDEIAFILGHEAAHHILGHIPQVQNSAMRAEILAGVAAAAAGADEATIRAAQEIGATLGARRYAKGFELQADALGAEIAALAGFDPLRGAAFFDRLPDPGNQFLGTHPPTAERRAAVRRAVAQLPRP